EKYFAGLQIHGRRDLAIALRVTFFPDVRVEVIVDKPREIARVGVYEQKLLGQHASRRKDTDLQSRPTPALERRRDVRKHLRLQTSIQVALPPDLSLQRLQRGRLAIAIDQPVGVIRNRFRRLKVVALVRGVFFTQERDVRTHLI